MSDNKKTFKEKWEDKKYQAKIKLSGYSIFVVIAIILVLIGGNSSSNTSSDINNDDIKKEEIKKDNKIFSIDYPYTLIINYSISDNSYSVVYNYSLNNDELFITKTSNDIVTNYKYIMNKYYVKSNGNYILTNINKVYDTIDYEYIDIDNINNYLNNSLLEGNIYKLYLKDIILNNNSNKYITIKLLDNNLEVDYTNLFNELEENIYDKYIIQIKK